MFISVVSFSGTELTFSSLCVRDNPKVTDLAKVFKCYNLGSNDFTLCHFLPNCPHAHISLVVLAKQLNSVSMIRATVMRWLWHTLREWVKEIWKMTNQYLEKHFCCHVLNHRTMTALYRETLFDFLLWHQYTTKVCFLDLKKQKRLNFKKNP